MKKIGILIVLLALPFVFFACAAQPSQQSAAPVATPVQEETGVGTASPQVDLSLLDESWKEVELPDANSVVFVQAQEGDSGASAMMTYEKHYEQREADVASDLKVNVDTYINKTLPNSMATAQSTQPEYFEIDGYPAAYFEVTGKLTSDSDEFLAATTFIANDKGIYCLQLQCRKTAIAEYQALFEAVKDSIKMA